MPSLLRREPSAILLTVQLAGVLLYPLMVGNHSSSAVFSVFGIAVLGLVVLAIRNTAAFTWVALVLGAPATVLLVIQAVTGSDRLLPYSSGLEAVLYFYAAAALIAHLLADPHITRDDLFSVGATFTLVAWSFAHVFTVCQAIEPGSFAIPGTAEEQRGWMELLYLSFTTLTSTGLSDVIPAKPFARGLLMIEMLAGVAYIAMLVSRLVGLSFMRQARSD